MRIPPPVLALGAALVQRAMSQDPRPPTRVRTAAAGATALVSLGLAGASSASFHRVGTTVDPLRPDRASALVTSGVNAVTRNPMYVGMAGVLVAHAIRRGSWAALLPMAAFAAVMDRVQIAAEEVALSDHFGKEYDDYRARVPRWLGPV
jgi:protein-S-isoprenylcysteine O-methyltransferase Ste14